VNFSGLADGLYFFNSTAADFVNNRNSTETRNVTINAQAPSVAINSPANGAGFKVNETVNITATVVDGGIDKVLANITFPNGSTSSFIMQNPTGSIYNFTFDDLLQKGNYSVRIVANDSVNNINASEIVSFTRVVEGNRTFDILSENNNFINFTHAVLNNASGVLDLELNFTGLNILQIKVFGYNELSPFNVLRIANSTNDSSRFNKTFAIDPTDLNFTTLNATVTAVGNTLYKCTNYTFSTGVCNDGYEFFQNIIAGQNYTLSLNASDPGFGDQSPDEGTPDNGAFEPFGDGFSSVVNTFTAMQANDEVYFAVRRANGGGAQLDLQSWMNVTYNITNLTNQGVTGNNIINLSFFIEYCFNQDIAGGFACGGAIAGGAPQNPHKIQIYNATSGSFVTFDNFNVSIAISTEVNDNSSIFSGFSDFISGDNLIIVRYEQNISITANGNDAAFGADFATLTVTFDNVRPNVTDLRPVNNSIFSVSQIIEIAANVTDNIAVGNVSANITLPNGTINQINLSFINGAKYNTSFTIPSLTGLYNITFIANDTKNNVNNTERTNFTAVDGINPQVTNLIPVNNSIFNVSNIIEIAANVTDNIAVGNVSANITLPNGTIQVLNLSFVNGAKYNTSFTIPSNLTGVYNITFIANDTSNNLNTSERTNFTANDPVFPTINFTSPTETSGSLLNRNFILINVTSNDTNLANITIRLFNASSQLENATTTINSSLFVNISGLADGLYFFNATAVDLANNRNSTETRNVTLDTRAPLINFTAPTETNNSFLNRNNILANVTVFDAAPDRINIILSNNSGIVQSNISGFGVSLLFINFTNLADGVYYLNATANDTTGNVNRTETRTITIDRTNPLINFTGPTPANNSFLAQNNISANVTANDTNLRNITIYLTNSSGLIQQNVSGVSPFFVNFINLADGVYFLNATANDTAGNLNRTETRTINLDTQAPLINITTPLNSSNFSTSLVGVNYTVSDSNLESCFYTNSSGLFNYTITCGNNISATWNEGTNVVRVYANDSFGNQNSSTVSFVVDTIFPTINFTSPTETSGSLLNRNFVLINVTANDTNLVNITIRLFNSSNSLVNITNSTTSPLFVNFSGLADGLYFFNSTAADFVNNRNSTETRNVTINAQAPLVFELKPVNNSIFNVTESIEIATNASDIGTGSVLANITLPNGTIQSLNLSFVNGAKYNSSFTIPSLGNYNITFIANDSANNINNSEKTNFTAVDNKPPIISLINPGNGVDFNTGDGTSVAFQYNVTEFNVTNCSLTLNSSIINDSVSAGLTINTSAGGVNGFTHLLGIGNYNWSVSCRDAGNLLGTSENRTFTITEPAAPAPTTAPGGGGGGGGSSSKPIQTEEIFVEEDIITIIPGALNVNVVVDEIEEREFIIVNMRNSSVSLDVEVVGEIAEFLEVNNGQQVFLTANQEITFPVEISLAKEGLLTGKIIFSSGEFKVEIPVTINVKSANFLFDVSVSISADQKVIEAGENQKAHIHLIQVGSKQKVDVVANYIIKDFNGNVYLEESETFFVLEAKDYVKEFFTRDLPPGKYIVGLEIVYPGAFATSSAQFEVAPTGLGKLSNQLIALVVVGGVFLIGAAVWFVRSFIILKKTIGAGRIAGKVYRKI
jgi:hypothetical protein